MNHLTLKAALADAEQATGHDDYGDQADPGFRDRVGLLIDNALNAELSQEGMHAFADCLRWHLTTRLKVMADRKRYPLADERIEKPLIATGEARSGTTLLHALLAEDPQARAMRFWQVFYPSPPTGLARPDDPRMAQADDDWRDILARIPKWLISHPYNDQLGMGLPECERFWAIDFRAAPPTGWWRVPAAGLAAGITTDVGRQYEIHRMMLQQAQHGAEPRRWVLKGTSHHRRLDALLDAYPDCCVIWVHRDPVRIVASFAELFGQIMDGILRRRASRGEIAAATLRGLRESIANTMVNPNVNDARVFHIAYDALVADPAKALERANAHFELPFSEAYRARVQRWLATNDSGRYGRFTYSMDVIDADIEALYEQFAPYMQRFEIRREG